MSKKAILVLSNEKQIFITIEEVKDEIDYYDNQTDKILKAKYVGAQYHVPFYKLKETENVEED